MIRLVPMSADEFDAYRERAIPEYAQEKVLAGQWSGEESIARAREGFEESLPQGVDSEDNYLLSLQDDATGAAVGMLWYAIQDRAGQRIAYLNDIQIERGCRRLGYATEAFRALEAEVVSRGCSGVLLHVFGHNLAARALYAKLGYEVTNVMMFKTLANAGPDASQSADDVKTPRGDPS